jgi:hypothetical protein
MTVLPLEQVYSACLKKGRRALEEPSLRRIVNEGRDDEEAANITYEHFLLLDDERPDSNQICSEMMKKPSFGPPSKAQLGGLLMDVSVFQHKRLGTETHPNLFSYLL